MDRLGKKQVDVAIIPLNAVSAPKKRAASQQKLSLETDVLSRTEDMPNTLSYDMRSLRLPPCAGAMHLQVMPVLSNSNIGNTLRLHWATLES